MVHGLATADNKSIGCYIAEVHMSPIGLHVVTPIWHYMLYALYITSALLQAGALYFCMVTVGCMETAFGELDVYWWSVLRFVVIQAFTVIVAG